MKTNANMSEAEAGKLRSLGAARIRAAAARKQFAFERYTRRYQRIGRIINHTWAPK